MAVVLVTAALVTPACSRPPTLGSAAVTEHSSGRATITLRPQVMSGSMRTQSLVAPYTRASISHLVVKVFALDGTQEVAQFNDGGTPVQADVSGDPTNSTVTFTGLHFDTIYRIRCFAYRAPGTSTQDLISTTDERSYTDLEVKENDQPPLASLRVQLIDVVFDGEATASGVAVSDGHVIYATSSVGIGVVPPATPSPTPLPSPTPSPGPSPTLRLAHFENLGNLDDTGKGLGNFTSPVMTSGDVLPGIYVLQLVVTKGLLHDSYAFRWGQATQGGYSYGPDAPITAWSPGAYVTVRGIGGMGLLALSLGQAKPVTTLYDRVTVQ